MASLSSSLSSMYLERKIEADWKSALTMGGWRPCPAGPSGFGKRTVEHVKVVGSFMGLLSLGVLSFVTKTFFTTCNLLIRKKIIILTSQDKFEPVRCKKDP